jgi:hypothetical protein
VKSINTVFIKYLINIVALSRSFFDGSIFSFHRIGLDYILNETSSRTFRCFVFPHRTWISPWKAISHRLCEVKSLHVGFSSSHIEKGRTFYLTWRTALSRFYQTLCWNFTKLSNWQFFSESCKIYIYVKSLAKGGLWLKVHQISLYF